MYSKEPIPSEIKNVTPESGGGKTAFDPTLRIEPIPRLKPTACCDFCGDDNPVYIYHSLYRTDGRPVIPFGAKVLRWAACESCTQAIDADNWKLVEERVEDRLKKYLRQHLNGKKPPETMVKETVQNVLKTFHNEVLHVL